MHLEHDLLQAAQWIAAADSLMVTAGAGMGVDSGLPDFRGAEGFWRAYPALGRRQMGFRDIATPSSFDLHPELAWGFYGHRLALYRQTLPHAGFALLQRWAQPKAHGLFVYTSNVDGQFQKAGFSENHILECHGSIHYLQCLRNCSGQFWSASELQVTLDEAQGEWRGHLPRCPTCGGLARPLVLMFDDSEWLDARTGLQQLNWSLWRQKVQRAVVIELGAGQAIPTVRRLGEQQPYPLIRINPQDSSLPAHRSGVALPLGALQALQAIDTLLQSMIN